MDEEHVRVGNGDLPPPSQATSVRADARTGNERVPPHSLEAEVSVLGAALLSQQAADDAIHMLRPGDFYRSAHATLFEGIVGLKASGSAIDALTLSEWLRAHGRLDEVGGAASVHGLSTAVPTAANARYYAQIVRDRAQLRQLIDAAAELARMGFEPTDDVRAVIDRAESLVFNLNAEGTLNDYSELKELLDDTYIAIEERSTRRDDVTGLRTGFVDLDRLTAGLQRQNLIIIAARPGVGKSSLALSIARFVSVDARRPSILFSLEMSKREIAERLLSAQARIDSQKLRIGQLEERDWGKLADALGSLSDAPLFIDDTPSITMMEILAKCRRLKAKRGLELVIVDYLQLMQSHRRVENRQQEVAEISRGMKMLAKDLDVPVIALSQLSRQPESRADRRPQLSDLRESGCLTRDTRLFRADTGIPITFGELLDGGLRDIPVWATDSSGRVVSARMTHAFASGTKPVHRVLLRSGLEVKATANHPFRTLEGWRPLGELGVGDRVATLRRIPEPGEPGYVDSDELVLLAHLIGDGTVVARQPIHYTSADPANLLAVEKAAWTRFGIQARRAPDGRSAVTTQMYLPAPFRLARGRRSPIAAWLDDLGCWNLRSYEKRLPPILFGLSDDQVRMFVHHLWATDGSIHVRRPENSGPPVSLYYATSSPRLAHDVQLLLLRLGLHTRILEVQQRSGRAGYQVCLFGAAQQRRFLTEVGIHGRRGELVGLALDRLAGIQSNPNVDVLPLSVWEWVRERRRQIGMTEREFQRRIGTAYCGSTLYRSAPSRRRLVRIAEVLDDDRLRMVATDDLRWDEIVGIEPVGDEPVFDATVDDHHNFVAEGLVLHNSLEQDADLVAFIYRDDIYDEQSPDKGIAELIVAKHRNGPVRTVHLAFLSHLTQFANVARDHQRPPSGAPGPEASPL